MAYIGNNSLPFDPTRTAAQPRDAERFNGDGSTVNFTLSRAVSNPTDVEVFVENVQQQPTIAYNIVGTTLSFTEAPPTGTYNVYVVYRAFNGGQQVTVPDGSITYAKLANNLKLFTTDNLLPDGSTVAFTLSDTPPDANTVMVSVDGITQRAPVHYTVSGRTITFTSAPPVGSNVHVRHLGIRTTETLTAIAANTTLPQPTIQTPTITGNTLAGPIRASEGYFGNTSSKINTYGPQYGYVLNVQSPSATANQQSFISIALSGQTPGSNGMIVGTDDGSSYLWNREDKRIDLGTNNTYRFRVPTSNTDFRATSNGSTSLQSAFFARAWVNFDGYTGAGTTIAKSGNVTSITRASTGNYYVNFTEAMIDANYACIANSEALYSTYTYVCPYNFYTTYVHITIVTPSPALINSRQTSVVIYR